MAEATTRPACGAEDADTQLMTVIGPEQADPAAAPDAAQQVARRRRAGWWRPRWSDRQARCGARAVQGRDAAHAPASWPAGRAMLAPWRSVRPRGADRAYGESWRPMCRASIKRRRAATARRWPRATAPKLDDTQPATPSGSTQRSTPRIGMGRYAHRRKCFELISNCGTTSYSDRFASLRFA